MMVAQLDLGLDIFLTALIFLGVLVSFEGLRQMTSRRESAADTRNRRMRSLARGGDRTLAPSILKPRANEWELERVPVIGLLPLLLRQAGLNHDPLRLAALALGAAVLFIFAAGRAVPYALAVPVGVALFVALPLAALRLVAARRIEKLTRQLPDALDLMARGLRVGHPLNVTMASVAREMPDPISTEFGLMVDQITYGDDLVAAVRDFARRMGTDDASFLAVSVAIQHGSGGDLGRMLMTLAKVVRDRLMMRRKIKAISSEGRLSAVILSTIPLAIVAAMTLLVPGYYGDIATDPLFRPASTIVVALVVANAVVMHRLVNFRF